MLLLENLKLAFRAIRVNKMRSFLTMLGIIIGISSVIAISAIGASAQALINGELDGFGKDRLIIYPNYQGGEIDTFRESDYFTLEDIEALKHKYGDNILYLSPSVSETVKVKGYDNVDISLTGINSGAEPYLTIELTKGRLINENDVLGKKDNIVVNEDTAKKLFRTTDVLGQKISMTVDGDDKEMTIVGVYKTEDSLFSGMMMGKSYFGYVAYSIMDSQLDRMSMIDFYHSEDMNIKAQGQKMVDYLSSIKGRDSGFYAFESTESQRTQINTMLGTLSTAIMCIAAISLVVGGIGIMNIMLVSVTERTREIGIRKSLGARINDILQQFLIESVILSVAGGIIGILLGFLLSYIGGVIVNVDVVIETSSIVGSVIFSAIVGIFFGLYPAKKAANLNPIEALRYE